MEPLSSLIKILFIRNSDEILNPMLDAAAPKYMDKVIDVKVLSHRLMNAGTYGTLDQAENEICLLKDKWMKKESAYHMLHFTKTPSVFNTLLHFSAPRLHLKDSHPICNYDKILSWNELTNITGEDLLVLSYLASRDIAEHRDNKYDFSWDTCLRCDYFALQELMTHPLTDVHSHLKGSSLNFELAWLCLMNHISSRQQEFQKLEEIKLAPTIEVEKVSLSSSLYSKVIKASAIRLFLYNIITKNSIRNISLTYLIDLLKSKNDICIFSLVGNLQTKLDIANYLSCEQLGTCDILDYAVVLFGKNTLNPLSGERYFLYKMFKYIYSGDLTLKEAYSTLFYYYLVVKEEVRKEINQVNGSIGFANFGEYESRKSLFIENYSKYDAALVRMAVGGFMDTVSNPNIYLEARITPKSRAFDIKRNILKLDKNIRNQIETKSDTSKWEYYYVCHFIKAKDFENIPENDNSFNQLRLSLTPRHYTLRHIVKSQALALYELRLSHCQQAERIVGIDAANSEIFCRPEVFAHAFRFLRSHRFERSDLFGNLPDLGRTYHVGEDFYSIADGLRAIEETMKFLHMGESDRFGHGLVLGCDVSKYYESRHFCISAPTQVILDNIAWLYVKASRVGGSTRILQYLKELFDKFLIKLYSPSDTVCSKGIYDYYQSWLLRGDEPVLYMTTDKDNVNEEWETKVKKYQCSVSNWNSTSLNYGYEFELARRNPSARQLYHDYHFNPIVKINGMRSDLLHIEREYREEFIQIIENVQRHILNDVENHHIAIECNPSSNLKIGEFGRYDEHPISKFYNKDLNTPYSEHNICVSINTDDRGVFSTSLEREYSLLASALEKSSTANFQNSSRSVIMWLDNIRRMGQEQKFKKDCNKRTEVAFNKWDSVDSSTISYFNDKAKNFVSTRNNNA